MFKGSFPVLGVLNSRGELEGVLAGDNGGGCAWSVLGVSTADAVLATDGDGGSVPTTGLSPESTVAKLKCSLFRVPA